MSRQPPGQGGYVPQHIYHPAGTPAQPPPMQGYVDPYGNYRTAQVAPPPPFPGGPPQQASDPYSNAAAGPSRGEAGVHQGYLHQQQQPQQQQQQQQQQAGPRGGHAAAPHQGTHAHPSHHQQQHHSTAAATHHAQTQAAHAQAEVSRSASGSWKKGNNVDDYDGSADTKASVASGGAGGGGTPGTSGNGGGGGGGGGSGQQAGPSEFIKKLYKMLEDESAQYGRGKPPGSRSKGETRGSVSWGRGGTSFVVLDMNEFQTKVLPQTFRHSNFSSFVRQLNKYGFSKIKHVDEETGQLKENIWEFQHPSFQAGGKADLDNIKRKVVVPKKGAAEDRESSPGAGRGAPAGLSPEDLNRILDVEGRMTVLEDVLYKTQQQLQDSRQREHNVLSLLREIVGHVASVDKASPTSDIESRQRIHRCLQLYDYANVSLNPTPPQGFVGGLTPPSYQQPQYSRSAYPPPPPPSGIPSFPISHYATVAPVGGPSAPIGGPGGGAPPSLSSHSPRMEHRTAGDSPGMRARREQQQQHHQHQHQQRKAADELPIEISPQSQQQQQQQYHGGGGDAMMAPVYGNEQNGQWTQPEANGTARTSIRFVVDTGAIPPQQNKGGASVVPVDDPMDAANGVAAAAAAVAAAAGNVAPPPANAESSSSTGPPAEARVVRQAATQIKPSWTQTPRILVVEDDVVYRQLSSKFLEKFGCVVETVENAQQGIEKMNNTKYDLVLMDIFFGPSMDGRKATSLIRQFDMYTPIISMTSNAQPKDVESYLKSGMNDILSKPFTKNSLFGILDKHLIHLKAIQLSAEVPRFMGVPPLSDQGIQDAITIGAQQWEMNGGDDAIGNPLAGSGWSDETYQLVLQQFMATGGMPDNNTGMPTTTSIIAGAGSQNLGALTAAMNTSVVFPADAGFGRKRTIKEIDDGSEPWEEQAKKQRS